MIILDYQDRRPIYEQIEEKVRALILQGILTADRKLPSVRKLAMDLSINPNTIQRAYNQLESSGFIYSIQGKGSYVSPDLELIELQLEQYYKELKSVILRGREKGVSQERMTQLVEEFYMEVLE